MAMRGTFRSLLIAVLLVTSVAPAMADRGRGQGYGDARFTPVRDDDDRGRGRGRDRDHDRARDGVREGRLVPLEAILGNIARSYPGYHIDVGGPYDSGGYLVYRIKWLTPDGHVLIIIADAQTGRILSVRGGR
jgi:Ni/Co efflux regulator RcnB